MGKRKEKESKIGANLINRCTQWHLNIRDLVARLNRHAV